MAGKSIVRTHPQNYAWGQDCCIVKLITSNRPSYLHMGTTLGLGKVLYALIRKTMHGVIVGKQVCTRPLSNHYCTRVWISLMFWCDQRDYPVSKVHGANMGPIWVLSAPDGPMLAPRTLLLGYAPVLERRVHTKSRDYTGWYRLLSCNEVVIYLWQPQVAFSNSIYRQVSYIRCTKSQNLKDSRTVLWLSLPTWSQMLSRQWRCSRSSADSRCSDYIWVIDNFIAY